MEDLAGPMIVDTPDGAHVLDGAPVDTDGDGRPDTVVAEPTGDAGPMLLATDLDGDAHADVVTTIGADGTAATVDEGPGGTLDVPAWDPGWDRPAPPAPTLDPVTGAWTRSA